MPTPHNSAQVGQIAATVLMPGDPLRAKFIAETFLEDAFEFNHVRGMLGFTGRYNGCDVSVMGSGMGMPSIGIYSWELYTMYGVESIIRVGSAGAYSPDFALFDLLLATGAYSESSYARTQNGYSGSNTRPAPVLNERLRQSAAARGKTLREGLVHSSDVFYRAQLPGTPYWHRLRDDEGCLAVEMESFALFHNAAVTGKKAACLLTISDSFVTPEITIPEQREKGFTDMMEVALGAVCLGEHDGI